MDNKFTFVIDDIKLVSTNDAYIPTYKGKRSFLRRSNSLLEFQKTFQEKALEFKEQALAFIEKERQAYKNLGIKIFLIFILPRDVYFYKRKKEDIRPQDTSNFIKSVEDQIALLLEVDDKYNLEVSAIKCYEDNRENSSIFVKVSCLDYIEQTKEKVFNSLKDKY